MMLWLLFGVPVLLGLSNLGDEMPAGEVHALRKGPTLLWLANGLLVVLWGVANLLLPT